MRSKSATEISFYFLYLLNASSRHFKIFFLSPNQTLHYYHEFKNFVVCHSDLSFQVTTTLFLFKTTTIFANLSHYLIYYPPPPPSHLFGIIRNQAEPAGMKNCQNSCHIREGISNPSHTRGGMSRNDVEMEIRCIFL